MSDGRLSLPVTRGFGGTSRPDAWWWTPALVFGVLREVARFAPGERPEILVVTNYPELATGKHGHLLRAGHVWGVISKSRLGEDPYTLNRALARISRDDGLRGAFAATSGA